MKSTIKLSTYAFLFVLIVFITLQSGCNDNGVSSIPSGKYSFASYDSLGALYSKGWININAGDTTNVTGTWQIEFGPGSKDAQTQNGNLGGLAFSKLHHPL
ncbi:MAG: hypothetical protein ACYCVH_00010 [Ignavibacteriaceae bacterium]